MNYLVLLFLALALGSCTHSQAADKHRPNILLIVADDLGYADLGVYGGAIETPNIDALAAGGVLFTQFHTAPMCSPTRAMLLSGNNNHVAGVARQHQIGLLDNPVAGYEGRLSDRIAPLPRLLQAAGYHTFTVGKWHLGMDAATSPHAAGFSHAFNLLDGGASHFDAVGFAAGGSTYRLNADLTTYPAGQYSTAVYTDKLIEFIDTTKNDGKPFFAYAAYTSPHWPLQVPDAYLNLYKGHYDEGYDVLRERRFGSLKRAGIIPAASKLPPRNDAITPWRELSAERQRRESRKMELYAAMVDNLDDHIGRLLAHLQANGQLQNTVIAFMSDNGAAGEDFYNRGPYKAYVRAHFDNAYETMGTAKSFVSYDEQWAEAGSAPFQRRKGYTREGGIVAPMIVMGPGVAARGTIDSNYLTVMDLAPTFLEIAGARYPNDGTVAPMLGESAVALLAGNADRVHDDSYVTTLYHKGVAYLRKGDWKIVTLDPPFDEAKFELFNMAQDPGEASNLSLAHAAKLAELTALWRSERKKLGIILPEDL